MAAIAPIAAVVATFFAAAPPAPIDLAISLVFGAGQVFVGGALAWRGLGGRRWRRLSLFALALLGLWVVCSGVAELIVSGLETGNRAWGRPGADAIAAVRGVADAGLLVAGIALAAVFALYLAVAWRAGWLAARHGRPS